MSTLAVQTVVTGVRIVRIIRGCPISTCWLVTMIKSNLSWHRTNLQRLEVRLFDAPCRLSSEQLLSGEHSWNIAETYLAGPRATEIRERPSRGVRAQC